MEVPLAYALLDSGATHPMRQARDQVEWEAACEVQVALAGDNTTSMRLTSSGTLLLPPGRDGSIQPIVPMGAIIEQLGYQLIWSAGSCKLYPPNGRSIRLRVKNGCPEVMESQALTLISRLEEHKLHQADELRRRAEEGKDSKQVITALAKAIQEIWKTTPLTMATPDTPSRSLGVLGLSCRSRPTQQSCCDSTTSSPQR